MTDGDEIRRQQDEAIARAGHRTNPTPHRGGASGRAVAEHDAARVLRNRPDYGVDPDVTNTADGHEALARALDDVVTAEHDASPPEPSGDIPNN